MGTFAGALAAREIVMQPDDLTGEAVGDVEKDGKVLILRRIHVRYSLRVDPGARDTAERVHDVHADFCPVARSIGPAVEITTAVDYR